MRATWRWLVSSGALDQTLAPAPHPRNAALPQGTDEQKAAAAAVLVSVLEAVRIVAVLLSPVTPALSRRIFQQLGFGEGGFDSLRWADTEWGQLEAGRALPAPAPVMQRLEGDFVTEPAPAAAVKA